MIRRLAATTILVGVGACGDAPPALLVSLELTVLDTVDGTVAIEDADQLCLQVEDLEGTPQGGRSCLDEPGQGGAGSFLEADPVPLGGPYRALVELIEDGRVLGRGRSYPFEVDADGPGGPVEVLVGEVERFGAAVAEAPWPAGSRPTGLSATRDGALIGTSDGAVYRLRTGGDGRPRIDLVSAVPDRSGATWAALTDGALIAVGGATEGATLFRGDGTIASTTGAGDADRLAPHRTGAVALAADPSSGDAWVFGGSGTPGRPEAHRLVREDGDRLRVEDVRDMPAGREDLVGVVLRDVVEGGSADPRTLLLGGNEPGSTFVFNPMGGTYRVEPLPPDDAGDPAPLAPGAAVAALSDELVLAAGGRGDDGGVRDDVRILQLGADGALREPLSERPLTRPRSQAAAVTYREDTALVVGGLRVGEAAEVTAEIVEIVRRFEVEVTLLDAPLPGAFPSPLGVALGNGTVFLVDADGAAIWFP